MESLKGPKQNFLETVQGKKVLFLENDLSLNYGLQYVHRILQLNSIENKIIYQVNEVDKVGELQSVINAIEEYDVIIFMSQWVYDTSLKLRKYAFDMKNKKIFIECYISEPTWYYKPNVVHDVYVLKPQQYDFEDESFWRFYKLSDKAFWAYENKFDK